MRYLYFIVVTTFILFFAWCVNDIRIMHQSVFELRERETKAIERCSPPQIEESIEVHSVTVTNEPELYAPVLEAKLYP